MNPENQSLRDVFVEVLTDGFISREEVDTLRTLLNAQGKIDKTEAELLFELHIQSMREKNHASWQTFFVESLLQYIVSSENGITSIHEDKAQWLLGKLQNREATDPSVQILLNRIQHEVTIIPESLRPIVASINF